MATFPLAGLGWGDVTVTFGFHDHYGPEYAAVVGRSQHQALDLVVRGQPNGGRGWQLVAIESGAVVRQPSGPGGQHQFAIETPRYQYWYTHNDSGPSGSYVQEGETVGTLGGQGTEDAPHLHFMVFDKAAGRYVDPTPFLSGVGGMFPGLPVLAGGSGPVGILLLAVGAIVVLELLD